MKAVYIAIAILAGAMIYGQSNAGSTSSNDSRALSDYYDKYTSQVAILPAEEKKRQSKEYWNCYPYGDKTVGYFKTQEQYENAYDPSIFAVD